MELERLSDFYDEKNIKSATVCLNKSKDKSAVEVRKIVAFDTLQDAENYAEDWVMTND